MCSQNRIQISVAYLVCRRQNHLELQYRPHVFMPSSCTQCNVHTCVEPYFKQTRFTKKPITRLYTSRWCKHVLVKLSISPHLWNIVIHKGFYAPAINDEENVLQCRERVNSGLCYLDPSRSAMRHLAVQMPVAQTLT